MEIPDLNDVRTFVAIGQEGTLTAAARELNLPTSTVSRALTVLKNTWTFCSYSEVRVGSS